VPIPKDYLERVYAGVLGKIIGVYLGRPFEGWSHDKILRELGPIRYYVHEQFDKPLVVIDDDVSGTFTFVRALPDYGNNAEISAAQIGET
jgi:ADP-ribosylglycohydrolase